ncbi:MAG: M56 family metallopeptidase [Gemmatimonadetes bacterium]|nr:M56 family metallopeptidase [Gemmatimonadota bacterium]
MLFLVSSWLVWGHLRSTVSLRNTLRRGRPMGHLVTPGGEFRLLSLEGIASPFAAGRRTVVLPDRTFDELTDVQLRAVVAHELGHLARRDPHWLWVARLMEKAFFFQPLNRLCRRRLEEVAELASDDLARRSVGSGRPLAESIAAVSGWIVMGSPAPALSRRPGLVSDRVARLLGPAPDSTPPMFSLRLGLILLMVLAALATPSLRSGSQDTVGSIEIVMRVEPSIGGGGAPSR